MRGSAHIVSAVAAFGAALAGPPTAAQTPAHLSTRDISDAEQARDTMNRFAACVVKARPNMTRDALAMRPGPEATTAMSELAKKECLAGGFLRMDPFIFRGALFRALYLREFGENAEALVFAPDSDPDTKLLRSFGECVIRAAPAATRVFVVADVASPEEKQAIADLGPALNSCVNPHQQIRFTLAALEAHLAEALYRNSVALSLGTDTVDDE